MKRIGLVVSVDQVGFLRSFYDSREPDPVHFALQAEMAGVNGIRANLRVDRKYLKEEDMELLNRQVKTSFYLQISPHQDIIHLVNSLRPHNLILAAERRDEKAATIGLDVSLLINELHGIVHNIDMRQTRVFLFIDPELDQIKAAAKLQVHGVLINIRDLMTASMTATTGKKKNQLSDAVRLARKYGLVVHLAGGVLAEQLPALNAIEGISAIHVGHQFVARSLLMGVVPAVKVFRDLIE